MVEVISWYKLTLNSTDPFPLKVRCFKANYIDTDIQFKNLYGALASFTYLRNGTKRYISEIK